jgi:hypothetical protein
VQAEAELRANYLDKRGIASLVEMQNAFFRIKIAESFESKMERKIYIWPFVVPNRILDLLKLNGAHRKLKPSLRRRYVK